MKSCILSECYVPIVPNYSKTRKLLPCEHNLIFQTFQIFQILLTFLILTLISPPNPMSVNLVT